MKQVIKICGLLFLSIFGLIFGAGMVEAGSTCGGTARECCYQVLECRSTITGELCVAGSFFCDCVYVPGDMCYWKDCEVIGSSCFATGCQIDTIQVNAPNCYWTCTEEGPYLSAWTPACGSQTRTCSEDCGTDDCSVADLTNCQHCAPTLGAWSACDADHLQTRTCTERDGACDGNDCAAQVLVQDCTGTIQGTLFDASDLSSCPGDIGTNPAYASLRLGNEAFGITGTWPAISLPVSTDADGNYSESVYGSTTNGTYSFDYTDLLASGRVQGVKLQCQGEQVAVTTNGQIVTKDTGFLPSSVALQSGLIPLA